MVTMTGGKLVKPAIELVIQKSSIKLKLKPAKRPSPQAERQELLFSESASIGIRAIKAQAQL